MKKVILLSILSVLFYSVPGHTVHTMPGGKRIQRGKGSGRGLRFNQRGPAGGVQAEQLPSPLPMYGPPAPDGWPQEEAPAQVPQEAPAELEAEEAEAAARAALAKMQASVKKCEEQATTSCGHLVAALQVWKKKTEGVFAEAYTAQRFIGVRKLYYPLCHSVEQSEIYAQECEIANRVSDIRLVTYGRACAAKAATIRAQAATIRAQAASVAEIEARLAAWAEEEALAAVAEEEAAVAAPLAKEEVATGPEIQRLKARCSEIISAEGVRGGSIPPGMQQEMCDISRRLLEEQRKELAELERAYGRFLEDEINNQAGVMALVDVGQDQVQQSFKDVEECYRHFFDQRAAAQKGMPFTQDTQDTHEAHLIVDAAGDLYRRCLELVGVTNNDAAEMRAQCSRAIAFVQGKQAEEELRKQQEAEAAAPVRAPESAADDKDPAYQKNKNI